MSKCICGEINARNCPVHQQSEIEQLEVENKKLRAANEVLRDGLELFVDSEYPYHALYPLELADKIMKGE